MKFVSINTASWDAHKQQSIAVVADAKTALTSIDSGLGDYRAPTETLTSSQAHIAEWHGYLDEWKDKPQNGKPAYAQVSKLSTPSATTMTYCLRRRRRSPGRTDNGLALEVGEQLRQ